MSDNSGIEDASWYEVSQADPRVVALYARHYSSKKNGKTRSDWLRLGISGPAETMTLLTTDGRAVFGWGKQEYRADRETGVNCFVFRNEGPCLSSRLILEAESLAWRRWPSERLFTHVDPTAVRR